MENQGKRLLLAVVLALAILFAWQWLFPSKPPQKSTKTDETEQKNFSSPVGIPSGASEAPEAPVGPEDITAFDYPNIHVEISNRDAKIVSWRLLDPKYGREWDKGEMIPDAEIGALGVNFYKSSIAIPKGTRWTKLPDAEEKPNEATYTYESEDLKIVKVFHIHPDDYLVNLTVSLELKGGDAKSPRKVSQQLAVSVVGQQDPKAPTKEARTVRVHRAACLFNGGVSQVDARKLEKNGPLERTGTVRWVGFNHPYLFTAVAPKRPDLHNLGCNMYPVEGLPGGMQVDLVYPSVEMSSQAPALKEELVAFIGPKHLTALEGADDVEDFSTGFGSSVDLGWFSIIARPLLSLLIWFHGFVGNWGIAIILLTICVKLATLYWTTKSMRSMKAMSSLKPKIDELQKKYGDDRAKVQQEMMALYKAHGVNPLSGCLPMLLQMPIWLALYKMLSSAGELYLTSFIPGWINDLTATDPFHILPVVLMGMMFLQSRLSPATVDNMQQKMMMYGLPLIFGVMGFFFPSGLTLYILTNTTLSLLHSFYMKKFDKGGKVVMVTPPPPAKKAQPEPEPEPEAESDSDDGEADEEPKAPVQKSNASRRKRRRKH